ncbi:hypothetical protein GXW83_24445 [Streptacidiphilus sp. PB12-B1b]|uniref:hypothetical protein n=1 Tax=Streptacidiphilus sp. PB12-B1b TaxID=2705012 RepID=UPI0015FE62D8|nr:hypothetical protein [Streptacidiphilus sp. PB12-B1b]QMU78388.1 hypothetical protein GXW83_24445 [Streptacidiphilus sp. PB12-B1b]
MSTPPEHEGLSPEPATDEEREREQETIEDNAVQVVEENEKTLVAEATQTVLSVADQVNETAIATTTPANNIAPPGSDGPPQVAVADQTPSSQLEAFQKSAENADELTKQQPERAKEWGTARWIGLCIGLTAVGGGIYLLVEYLKRLSAKQPVDDLPTVPTQTTDTLKALVQAWQDLPDAKYWTTLADYVDKYPGSLTPIDQALFMRCTEEMCPDDVTFIWDTEQDKADYVTDLVNLVNQNNGNTSVIYRSVITKAYEGDILPRIAAADVLLLALCWIFHMKTGTAPRADLAAPSASPRPVVALVALEPGRHPDAYLRAWARGFRELHGVRPLEWPGLPFGTRTGPLGPAMGRSAAMSSPGADLPLLPGESVTRTVSATLQEPFGAIAVGTSVILRQTNMATLALLYPQLRTLGQDAPAAPAPLALSTGSVDWSDGLHAALSLAGNLAWIMPPPWGAIGSAAISLIDMLLPNNAEDPFQQAMDGLRTFLTLEQVQESAEYLQTYATWLQQLQAKLQLLTHPGAAYITEQLNYLAEATSPNGQLFVQIAKLDFLRTQTDNAFPVSMLAESLAVLSLKMIVQLQATLADIAQDAGDDAGFAQQADAWMGTYVDLLVHTRGGAGAPGCIEQIADYIEGRCTQRLSEIKTPFQTTRIIQGQSVAGWTFTDEDPGVGDDTYTHFVTGSDPTTVNQNFHDYVIQITTALDTLYLPARKTLREWQNAILDWEHHMPPQAPQAPPQVQDTGWGAAAPTGSPWTVYTQVRYAAMNVNSGGPSALSAWSDYTLLQGRAHPTLALAPDPTHMTSGIRVYRQFADDDGGTSPMRLVGVSTGTAMTTYQDTKN